MKLFIWQSLDKVSGNYHPEGGVIIIAKDLERAKEIANFKVYEREDNKSLDVKIDLTEPDYQCDCEGEEKLFIFPNAGCC